MTRGILWRLVERRLCRVIAPQRQAAVLGDLQEDYTRRRASGGSIDAALWLLREARSLTREYRHYESRGRFMFIDELRHASRRLKSRPGSSLLCAALLAVGIGLTTAVFSVADSILWRPAPFPHANRLVRDAGAVRPHAVVQAWRESGLFDLVATWDTETRRYGAPDNLVTWATADISAGGLDLLGARTLRGRLLTPEDERTGGVIVISERLWRTTFSGDPDLVGRRIRVDDLDVTVVGIVRATFRFPEAATIAWAPLDAGAASKKTVNLLARIRAGIPRGDVELRMTEIAQRVAGATAAPVVLQPIDGIPIGTFVRGALPLLFGGVAAVFLVLCANVSGLLLTQLSARQRELSMCAALGADRRRLLLETMIEHGLIGAGGIAGGLGLAYVLMSAVPLVFVDRTLNPVDLDLRALAAACALGAVAVLLGGLWPAWIGTRRDPIDAVRGSAAAVESRVARATSRALLVGQIGLAGALLVGSAVLVRTFVNLVSADRGVDIDGVMRSQVVLLDAAIAASGRDRAKRENVAHALAMAIQDRLKSWPSVESVALSRRVPPESTIAAQATASIRSDVPGAVAVPVALQEYAVTPAFFDVYRIAVLRGGFVPDSGPMDVIVGERLAGLLWPGEDPLGRTFWRDKESAPFRVVGLAREMTLPTLDATMDRPEFYRLLRPVGWVPYLSLRCRGTCPTPEAISALIRDVHPEIDLSRMFADAETDYLNHLRIPRAMAELGGLFTIVAVLTAAGGLFSVMTQTVGRRRREFGIRSALGASPGALRSVIYREVLTLTASGVVVGAAAGSLVASALAAFQYGVSAADPSTWVIVIGTITITSLTAVWRPARQAARVDPVRLLRED
jgi:predicted permease